MKRRQRPPVGVPAYLATFRPEDWPAGTEWEAHVLWVAALEQWSQAHPDAAEAVDTVRWSVVTPDAPWDPSLI